MNCNTSQVLLVEDSYDYGQILVALLQSEAPNRFHLRQVPRLTESLVLLKEQPFDIILLDLNLPDSDGLETFRRLHTSCPDLPIVILTSLVDESQAIRAVHEGAQDYLFKTDIEAAQLARSLQYAIERNRSLAKLRHLSMTDELTGLLNRRGFLSLAEQQLRLARRSNHQVLLFFADLDHLKDVNDSYGHQAGDEALRSVAGLLQATFRSSDVIARIGGDEFCALAIGTHGTGRTILTRLDEGLLQINAGPTPYTINLTIGVAHFDPNDETNLGALLRQADQDLYEKKRSKQDK